MVVADTSKRLQIMRELKSLKKTMVDQNGSNKCVNVVSLLDVVSHPKEGTLSICLEYMNGGSLQDIVQMGGCKSESMMANIAKQMLLGLYTYIYIYI
jgi:serine/threonine protein kinase